MFFFVQIQMTVKQSQINYLCCHCIRDVDAKQKQNSYVKMYMSKLIVCTINLGSLLYFIGS